MPYDPTMHGEALAALLRAVESQDGVPPLTEHKAMRRGRADVEIVVVQDGAVAAYAQAARHPSNGARGAYWAIELVGIDRDALAEALQGITGRLPADEPHTVWAWTERGRTVLEAAGYREVRRLYRLERPLPIEEAPVTPAGVHVDTFAPGDEKALVEINNAAFAGHPENGALTVDDVLLRMQQPWFDPEGLFLARRDGRLVGFCWTKRHPEGVGEIYIIGVHPEARGRGLGRALVLVGLRDLHDRQGCDTGMLYVDGANAAAVWLYTELGFESVFVNAEYASDSAASG